ncbi:MAG: transposase, partial [Candidatus Aenigmatarchaeota archaeon]
FPLDKLKDIRDNMLYGITHIVKKYGFFRYPVDIAIDPFDDPYYGDRNDIHVVGTKNKAGTNYAHSFVCADSLIHGERFNLGFMDRTIYTKDSKLIEDLLKSALELVDIRIAMLDKEFYQVEIVKIMYRYNLNFIIPAPDTSEVTRLKNQHKDNLPIVVDHIMTSGKKEQVSVKLALVERMNKKGEKVIHGFITNLDWEPQEVSEHYRKRWGIETNNRVRNKFLAMTSSRDYGLRFLYYLMAVMLHNVWIFLNFIASRMLYKSISIIMMPVYKLKRFVLRKLESLGKVF